MKQFWLGMTSKIADMRDKVKDKLSKKKPENPTEGIEFPLEQEEDFSGFKNPAATPRPQASRPPMPKSFEQESELDEALAEPAYEEGPKPIKIREPINIKKLIIVTVLLLIVGGVSGLFYYVSNIDWNQHKDKIAEQFSEITGKRIVFDGPVHLTLFPSANLTAEDIKIYNPGDAEEEPLAKIKSLVADLNVMPLINGDFDIKMMSLVEPDIRLEMMDDGKLNWESTLSEGQKARMEEVKLILDSVMIKNAKLNFIDVGRDISFHIDSLNAEVIAEGIFGPYRIEGTYMKDNNPEGFAFSIGKLSSGFATTVNLVVNQPTTETFVRFDGSILPQNNAVNGNLIFDSKKLMSFVNSTFKDYKLPKEYDYPLAVNLEIKSNKTKIDFTNFVMKYGTTAGAGNLLIPLNDGVIPFRNEGEGGDALRPKIELGFNFTELDFDPVMAIVKSLFEKFNTNEANYNPELSFDLLADIKAIKTRYRDQVIKDFKLSFDVVDNNINIRDLSGVLPGDTALGIKGNIYSDLGHLSYNLDTNLKTDEFLQTLKWLDIKPNISSDTMLRRISLNAKVGGNFQKIGINPFEVSIDKSSVKGEIGIIRAERNSLYLNVMSDMINFDNYFQPMPKEIAQQDFESRMNYRMTQLAFLNDFDAEMELKLDLGIYESMPFENTKFSGSLKRGLLEVKNLDIASAANAQFNFKGHIKGFGQNFAFENLKYDVVTKDMASFLNKLDISTPNIDFKKLKNFSSKGIATGLVNRMAVKTISKLENININYGGQISKKESNFIYNGDLELRSPDFVKMLNDFNVAYAPKAFSLGLFNLKAKVVGKPNYFNANPIEFNVGSNTFKGNLDFDGTQERVSIKTDMEINKFEIEKFFYNDALIKDAANSTFQPQPLGNKVDLWSKPIFDKTKINYDFYNKFDFVGNFKINRLNYREYVFDFVDFALALKDSTAKLDHFKADYHGGKVMADMELGLVVDKPFLKGDVQLIKYSIAEGTMVGDKYGFKGGVLDSKFTFDTSADSFSDMYSNLSGVANVSIFNTSFLGWNISGIYKDLLQRQTSDGLTKFVKDNLQSGEEYLTSVTANIAFNKGKYTIQNADFGTDSFVVNFTDQGDINSWETKSVFDVKYAKPDYLPGFKFMLNGSLMSPLLEVDTEALAVMYNNRQAEVDAQIEKEKKVVQDRLNKSMDDQMLLIKATESDLQNVVKAELNSRVEKTEDPEAMKNYQDLLEKVKTMEAEVAELQLMSQTPNFDEELIRLMGERNNNIAAEIKRTKDLIAENNLRNVKFVINDKYNKIVGQNNEAKKLGEDYRERYSDLGKRLSKIQTGYRLQEDQNIKRIRNNIEGNLLALDNISNSVQSDFVKMQGSSDLIALEKYATDINMMQVDAMKYVPSLRGNVDDLFNYADERVALEEKIYAKKKEDEENQKKLEENTGMISVKGTGVSKTVVRGLEEIEKSEQAVDKKDVKVLDFTEEKAPVENVVYSAEKPKSVSGGVIKKDSGIVSQSSGKISKASGVIIKK